MLLSWKNALVIRYDEITPAQDNVLSCTELLERIILHLPLEDIVRSNEVCQQWLLVSNSSISIQRVLSKKPFPAASLPVRVNPYLGYLLVIPGESSYYTVVRLEDDLNPPPNFMHLTNPPTPIYSEAQLSHFKTVPSDIWTAVGDWAEEENQLRWLSKGAPAPLFEGERRHKYPWQPSLTAHEFRHKAQGAPDADSLTTCYGSTESFTAHIPSTWKNYTIKSTGWDVLLGR